MEVSKVVGGGMLLPEYRLVEDEVRSTCPLLPSPSALHFTHPLSHLTGTDGDSKGGGSPSSIATDLSLVPTEQSILPHTPEDVMMGVGVLCEDKSSSGSSSCVLAETELLHPHRYQTAVVPPVGDSLQEKGGLTVELVGLSLGKSALEYSFVSWNWPIIRKWAQWAALLASLAVTFIIALFIYQTPRSCDPSRRWFQGALVYRVFPAAFQDSDADGIGDIRGLAARLPYLSKLGVGVLRLAYIYPGQHYPEHYDTVTNLTSVDPSLGTMDDFNYLLVLLHQRNISLVLDLPIYPYLDELRQKDPFEDIQETHGVKHVIMNNHILVSPANKTRSLGEGRSIVTEILKFWVAIGVDGVFLEGLEQLAEDERFPSQLVEWRQVLGSERMLACSAEVLRRMDPEYITVALNTIDLVEVRLESDIEGLVTGVATVLSGALFSGPGYPWPLWSFGEIGGTRLATTLPSVNLSLAYTVLSMTLPGSNSVLYGDEFGLHNLYHHHNQRGEEEDEHRDSPGLMVWGPGGRAFTQAGSLPWLPLSGPAVPPALAAAILHQVSTLRDTSPSLYLHAVWANSRLHSNTIIKDLGGGLVSVVRCYPRRHKYLLLANLGTAAVTKDLSAQHYGGEVLVDHNGPTDRYMTFRTLTLHPGQFILVKLAR